MSKNVIGIDGCRGGWLVCRIAVRTTEIDLVAVVDRIDYVLDREASAGHIGVDIPIGLPQVGCARKVDGAARRLLTNVRGSSVFRLRHVSC